MYESPMIQEVGSVRDLTLGQGLRGSDDSLGWFSWGTNPDPSS
ncbi:lasso RiPP family leader peptide-containing protein [Occultella kanbiaonis]|nr:lasso RiPP family leader peptide-containing protein [Occultella kanbiaonis]